MARLQILGNSCAGMCSSVYIKPRRVCAEESYCAGLSSSRLIKAVLRLGTAVVIAAVGGNIMAPFLV